MVVQRDRTNELYAIFSSLKAQQQHSALVAAQRPPGQGETGPNSSPLGPAVPLPEAIPNTTPPAVSQFYEHAQSFSGELSAASDSIANLTQLIQQQTVFDDGATEISTLTNIVKERLARLHDDLTLLSALKEEAMAAARCSTQAVRHGDTVVSTLRSRLVSTSQSFKNVLQQRTRSMKETCSRRNQFSSDRPTTFESALFQNAESAAPSDDMLGGPAAAGGGGAYGASSAVTLAGPTHANYFKSRYEAVRQLETAVNEVGELFNDFTRLVHEQDELIVRIDTNVDDALTSVNSGTSELWKYLASLSTNRGLIIKIFAVLFFFLLFFGLVVVR